MDQPWERSHAGATTGQRVRAIRRAGLYIPERRHTDDVIALAGLGPR